MPLNSKQNVGSQARDRKSNHSLIMRLSKPSVEATGHGVYILPLVLLILVVFWGLAS